MTGKAGWNTGDVLLGEFLVEGLLGRGAMGTVYRVQRLFDERRFAVKRISPDLTENMAIRRLFMRELKTWVELPEHPNLVTCLFFRFIDGQLAIFNEYMDGGTLLKRIRSKTLRDIATILDIAIQMAWGIQTAHDFGVIHQDIKPANVLLGSDGIVKITDFGLARVRYMSVDAAGGDDGDTMHISGNGMTPAYCSPEQAGKSRLTHRTDMWSWAVSVLEIFVGDTPWRLGTVAPSALNSFVAAPPPDATPMPDALVEVLGQCFQYRVLDRWRTMAEIAEHLQAIYRTVTGSDYPRDAPVLDEADRLPVSIGRGSKSGEFRWRDPGQWLNMAVTAVGKRLESYESLLKPFRGTRKTRALMDLEIIQEAENIMAAVINGSNQTLKDIYRKMRRDRAAIHGYLSDFPAALGILDALIREYESEAEPELPVLADLYFRKSRIHLHEGDLKNAAKAGEKHVAARHRLMGDSNSLAARFEYARACSDLSGTFEQWGRYDAAMALLKKSDVILDEMEKTGVDSRWIRIRAGNRMISGNIHVKRGEFQDALEDYRESVSLRETRLSDSDDIMPLFELALALVNTANTQQQLEQWDDAESTSRRAMELLEHLVERRKHLEYREYLASVYYNYGSLLINRERFDEAEMLISRAIELVRRMVNREHKLHLMMLLAFGYAGAGDLRLNTGRPAEAIDYFQRAIRIGEYRLLNEGRIEERGILARFRASRAEALLESGNSEQAEQEFEAVIPILKREYARTGNIVFKKHLEGIEEMMESIRADREPCDSGGDPPFSRA